MPILGITSLCPWERHLKLISLQALSVVWKTSICFTVAYTEEKTKKLNKKQANMVLPVSPKVGVGYNFPMIKAYDVVPRVKRINRTN